MSNWSQSSWGSRGSWGLGGWESAGWNGSNWRGASAQDPAAAGSNAFVCDPGAASPWGKGGWWSSNNGKWSLPAAAHVPLAVPDTAAEGGGPTSEHNLPGGNRPTPSLENQSGEGSVGVAGRDRSPVLLATPRPAGAIKLEGGADGDNSTPTSTPAFEKWWLGVDAGIREKHALEMRVWLRDIDERLVEYAGILEENYDTVDQICRLYIVDSNAHKHLDPLFFDDNGINDHDHRLLFGRWFAGHRGAELPECLEVATGGGSGPSTTSSARDPTDVAVEPQRCDGHNEIKCGLNGVGFGSDNADGPREEGNADSEVGNGTGGSDVAATRGGISAISKNGANDAVPRGEPWLWRTSGGWGSWANGKHSWSDAGSSGSGWWNNNWPKNRNGSSSKFAENSWGECWGKKADDGGTGTS